MMKKLLFLLLPLFLISSVARADSPPDKLLETSITSLLDTFQSRRAELEADKSKLYELVETEVVPFFDVEIIARLVLAKHWRSASDAQKTDFAEAFKRLLIRTYATALFEYTGNERMEVRPAKIEPGATKTKVNTEVILSDQSAPISVNYSFRLNKAEQWKIYDVNIDGISLVKNYRTSYGQMISKNGLDRLIEEIRNKNANLESETLDRAG